MVQGKFNSIWCCGLLQVIVNRSRVIWRGLDLNIPVRLTALEKLPTITSGVRNMLESHPRVFLENEKPRCYVSEVGPASFNLSVTCNLKPMVGNSCLQSLSTIQSWWLYLHFEVLIPSMYLPQQTDMLNCLHSQSSLTSTFPVLCRASMTS